MNEFGFRQERTNRSAPAVVCVVCGGDRFVVVRTRPVPQTPWMREKGITPPSSSKIDEYAPCPSCNGDVDTSFYRHDGPAFRSPDPAKVREMLEKR